MSAANRRPPPKPWSMKWIVAAILIFVVGYTLVNLYYRKPGPGYRPYQDAQDRATTARLLAAGWQKVPVDTRRPAETPGSDDRPAGFTREASGLGADLEAKFAEPPQLAATIDHVIAPAAVERGKNYKAFFTATVSDQKQQISDLVLYRRGTELVFIPSTESLPGKDLRGRWPDNTYSLSFSTAGLPTGRYQARIVAQGAAAAWRFNIK